MWRVIVTSVCLSAYVVSHVPDPPKAGLSKADEMCDLADSCMHDTIPVCGQMGEVKRTFLDLCDMIEFGCDTSQVYLHVEGNHECPNHESLTPKPKVKITRKGNIKKHHN